MVLRIDTPPDAAFDPADIKMRRARFRTKPRANIGWSASILAWLVWWKIASRSAVAVKVISASDSSSST